MLNHKKIGLFGNPNSGKSSLFNALTGLKQKTGNFGGVTVEKKVGKLSLGKNIKADLIDFPGSYSLHAISLDEKIVTSVLLQPEEKAYPDLAIYLMDIEHLERHLLFLTQLIDLKIPLIIALNMADRDINFAPKVKLINEFFDLPTLEISSKTGQGLVALKTLINTVLENPDTGLSSKSFFPKDELLRRAEWDELKTGSEAPEYRELVEIVNNSKLHKPALGLQVWDTMFRFEKLEPLMLAPELRKSPTPSNELTKKLDKVLLHPFWGIIVFILILWLIFQSIFNLAEKPIDMLETSFTYVVGWVHQLLPAGWITNLIANGLIPGLSGIIVFVPQIALLFIFISILEETGYMTRVVFLFNFLMRKFGLNGRSIVALISGGACAVPAILSTRTIGNAKERLITIMATPLISCSARLPVYSLLIAYVIPAGFMWGFINKRGLAFFSIYVISTLFALFVAYLLKKMVKSDEPSQMMLELPDYKLPILKNIYHNVYEKIRSFISEAGKIILMISVVLWALASYGPGDRMDQAEAAQKIRLANPKPGEQLANVEAIRLENSYAGLMGQWIEPVIKPLGFDWKIGIALITSFAAREVFVGTIATIYSAQQDDTPENLSAMLAKQVNPNTGKKVFNLATSASLIVFYIFALQCLSTLAVVKKETGSWKWPMIQLFAYSGFAYLASLIVYQVLSSWS